MIKNDRWIVEQARRGMITPFTRELIREVKVTGGPRANGRSAKRMQGVISYGLSSYGYDIRLSPKEFRIFRHVPGTVLNPKAFNPQNLEAASLSEDEFGKFFVLPSHSYGLGVALERLAVPRDVSVICLGKSTYARCFSEDTKVNLVDGDYSFAEMVELEASGHELFGFGVDADDKVVIQRLFAPRQTGVEDTLVIELDNGSEIECTEGHVFFTKSLKQLPASSLKPGTVLRTMAVKNSQKMPRRVVKVRPGHRTQAVYCLTAELGAFFLADGILVKNCGLIANMTPAEAGWRGHLTLEFSNSSSADCRIYANEGVVQLLFFGGDPCEVSYEARKGKYQDQPEAVTIAKV